MELPTQPVTLDVPQIEDLSRHFSAFRHDVNGCLALIVAATELIRFNPAALTRMSTTLVEQPPKMAGKMREFIEHFQRTMQLRPAGENAWYPGLFNRTSQVFSPINGPSTISADDAKALQNEVMQATRDLFQLGFLISGAGALNKVNASNGGEVLPNITDQFIKVASKMDSVISSLNKATGVEATPNKRMLSGAPTGSVTFSPEEAATWLARLAEFQNELHAQLTPLLELSRLARANPQQLVARAGEYSQVSPMISEIINRFAADFDRVLNIKRPAPTA